MAKQTKKEATTEETKTAPKKERKVREKKDSFARNNYVEINNYDGVRTSVMHIRTVGSVVREEALNKAGEVISVSSVFIPGVKVKTKKDLKYMIVDKPKNKKGKQAETSDEDED